jgi:hypothetical protein
MSNRYKRAGGAWAMLLALLVWWHTSPAEALEGWATNGLSETSAPVVITQLNRAAATAPQVYIVSPRPEEVIADTNVAVQLQVAGTPIFKNSQLGLGPHLHLLLDRVPTESIYDLNTPIILSNLTPGTHTLQVLANKPWHESWKNPQAFAQVTFHVLAKSTNQLNTSSPNAQTPQLISVQPTAVGAEPWLLDFYVANAPSHIDAQHPLRQIADWRVRATVNEESFEVNRDEPLYLRGLRLGVNVLKLEYLNDQGQVVDSTLRVVKYQPNGNDGLSRLVRNELSIDQALTLFDPQSQYSVVGVTGNELGQSDRSPQVPTERSSTAIPSMQQGNQGMQSNPVIQNNPGMQNNPRMYGNSGTQSNPVMQGNSGSQSNPAGIYGNSGTQNNPGIYGNLGTQNNPGIYGNSGTQSNPGTYGNSGSQSNPAGMYGNSGTQSNPGTYGNSGSQSNPAGMYGNSGTQNNPGTYGNPGMQNNPRMYGNSGAQNNLGTYGNSGAQNNPGTYGNSGAQNNPGIYGNSGAQNNPGIYGNSGAQNNPGTYGNSGAQNNPGTYGNSGAQNNPGTYGNSGAQNNPGTYGNSGAQNNLGTYGNSGTPNNPGIYGNSGAQNNSGIYGNSGAQNNPGTYGNSGSQNNPGIYGNSINPVSPRSTLPVPSRTFSNSAEISQPKRTQQPIAEGTIKTIEGTIKTTEDTTEAIASLPPINQQRTEITANPQHQFPNFSSKDIALLPPVQPQPTSPNSRTAEPKEPIVAIAPPVTKQSQKTTADPTPKILPTNPPAPKSPTVPSPSNNPIAAGEAPLAPKAIVPTDPKSSPPATNEKVVDFKVIGQEIWHTTSVKIKKFTNQIPPLANSWGEKFRHWLGDRIAAMRADSSPTTPSKT